MTTTTKRGRPPKRTPDGRPTRELVREAARDPLRTVYEITEWANDQFGGDESVSGAPVRPPPGGVPPLTRGVRHGKK